MPRAEAFAEANGTGNEERRAWKDVQTPDADLLPIKTKRGWIVPKQPANDADASEEEEQNNSDDENKDSADFAGKKETKKNRSPSSNQQTPLDAAQLKKHIAQTALLIVEDAETHAGKLSRFRVMLRDMKFSAASDPQALQSVLAVLNSLLAIYKEICPSFVIRALTEAEKSAPISKDVKRQRDYEQALLNGVDTFFHELKFFLIELRAKTGVDVATMCAFKVDVFRIVCEAVFFLREFNFHEQFLALACRFAVSDAFGACVGRSTEAVSRCSALFVAFVGRLVEADAVGSSSVAVVRCVSDRVAANSFSVVDCAYLADVVDSVFRRLHILTHFTPCKVAATRPKDLPVAAAEAAPESRAPGAKHISKQQKRRLKEQSKDAAADAQRASIATAKRQNSNHQEALKGVFRVYFGVLKHADCTTAADAAMLGACLRGITAYVTLIGVEYWADLLRSLRAVASADRLHVTFDDKADADGDGGASASQASVCTALSVLLSAAKIAVLRVESAFFDMKGFHGFLYELLRKLLDASTRHSVSLTPTVLTMFGDVLGAVLTGRGVACELLPVERRAAFAVILARLAVQREAFADAGTWRDALLALCRRSRPALDFLWDGSDEACVSNGVYAPHAADPDRANACCTTLAEVFAKTPSSPAVISLLQALRTVK